MLPGPCITLVINVLNLLIIGMDERLKIFQLVNNEKLLAVAIVDNSNDHFGNVIIRSSWVKGLQ